MLIQCITFVKIHCITCIALNYCLNETLPLGCELYSRELDSQQKVLQLFSQFLLISLLVKLFFDYGY